MAITAEPKIVMIDNKTRYSTPRFDTNDFPFTKDHKMVNWTRKVI